MAISHFNGTKTHVHASHETKCPICNRVSCISCIKAMLSSIKGQSKQDLWYKTYHYVVSNNLNWAPFCHSCQFCSKHNLQTSHEQQKTNTSVEFGNFSGSLLYPQFNLCIMSPPKGIVDIHSIGEYKPSKKIMTQDIKTM